MSSKEHEDRLGQSETGWAETQGNEQLNSQSTWARGRRSLGAGAQGQSWDPASPRSQAASNTPADGASEREAGEEPGKLGKLSTGAPSLRSSGRMGRGSKTRGGPRQVRAPGKPWLEASPGGAGGGGERSPGAVSARVLWPHWPQQ